MRVAIYGRKVTKQNAGFIQEILKLMKEFNWNVVLEKDLKADIEKKIACNNTCDSFSSHLDFQSGIDLVLSIGGDGTFLKSVTYVRDSGVPILGVNTGRLGFLANISKDQIHHALDEVKNGNFTHQKRSLLRVESESDLFGEDNFALNEVTIHKKDNASMITVHAKLDGNYLNSYWADGLIVATPTGSTAYSLSCGGPIITPGCQVHILTPIAPHNLNVRPMVVPDHMPVELSVEGRGRRFLISLDSTAKSIRQGEIMVVRKAEYMINVVKFEETTFLNTIRNKMLWGLDRRN